MTQESLFLKFIRSTLKKWVGFQVAIDEGFGGQYSREKEEWLGTEIENYFKLYDDVKPDDLEEYVGTMIENEFDTIFEDGSLMETCKLFCKAYKLALENPNDRLFQDLKEPQPASPKVSNVSKQNEQVVTENVTTEIQQLNINDGEEGWTVVNRKHKK